jgi:hypothetical protein
MSTRTADDNERGSAAPENVERRHGRTGQSQDASRHQQDAAHHKGRDNPQPGTSQSGSESK